MSGRKKRKPDFRRIRTTKTYSVSEIGKALGRNQATVRRWLRDGLPTIDDQRPPIVHGADLKAWLVTRWDKGKRPCQPGELYCCKCRRPRKPADNSFSIEPHNDKTVTLKGLCSVCGTRMSQAGSRAKELEIRQVFDAPMPALQRMDRCNKPNVKRTVQPTSTEGAPIKRKSTQLSLGF